MKICAEYRICVQNEKSEYMMVFFVVALPAYIYDMHGKMKMKIEYEYADDFVENTI